VVGTHEAPPFVIRRSDGTWTGLSIELWRELAQDLALEFELREHSIDGLVSGLQTGELDVAVAALTMTAERERRVDFCHPFYSSGLGIAVATGPRGSRILSELASALLSLQFLRAVLALAAVLLGAGALVWLFERRANPEQFGGRVAHGLGAAFWWSAVTMTTVGYGDKAPRTMGGRLVALVWMFASVILISGFTAAIASSLTVSHLEADIEGPEDLPRRVIATVADSTSAQFLAGVRADPRFYPGVLEAAEAVVAGEAEAVVYDAPLLRYLSLTALEGRLEVQPGIFSRQDYAFALPQGSALREPINRVLLARIRGPEWAEWLKNFVGQR